LTDTSHARWSRRVVVDIIELSDALLIISGAVLAYLVHASSPFGPAMNLVLAIEAGLILALITTGFFRHAGLYDSRRMDAFPVKPLAILGRMGLTFCLAVSLALSFHVISIEPVSWFPLWFAASYSAIVASRLGASAFLRKKARQGYFHSHVAVFGSGVIARRLRDYLLAHATGMHLVGVYDDRNERSLQPVEALEPNGTLEDLIAEGRRGTIDQIIIALPASADARIAEVARRLEQIPASMHVCTHILSDLIDRKTASHKVSSIGPIGLIDIKRKPLADWGRILKAALDYGLGGLLLVLALPLFALIAIAIKLDSRGPVFFRQRRRGLNHRLIEVFKFRSMKVLEEGAEVKQATKGDPRVTRVGRLLRATSLDELPQLINVVRGEMSLVGPRPHALVHDEFYGELLESYANRHQVKPGMTGWAQINGFRGETETHDKMRLRVEHDLHYIDNWSFVLDLKILVLTPFYGLLGKNAY
jgi:Undecaprenyl-phosphate glucose phosphotransferase